MDKQQIDIEQIRKYLNGELSPKEMNSLEARALDNPFLQDALDGFEEFGVNPKDLDNLSENLAERLKEKNKVVTPQWGIKQWGIAASLVFCIALASIYFNQTPENKTIALNELQKKEDIPKAEKLKIAAEEENNKEQFTSLAETIKENNNVAFAEPQPGTLSKKSYAPEADVILEPMQQAAPLSTDTMLSLDEVAVTGYAAAAKKSITGSVSSLKAENLMAARTAKAAEESPKIKIRGKVTDEKDGNALLGVSIKNNKTGETKQTNASGEFSIDAPSKSDLIVSYLGYETKTASVNGKDSLAIALKPSEASLSEVVVVGYGITPSQKSYLVGPIAGWPAFKKYLEEKAALYNLGKGKVEVQFIIQNNGALTDFKILKTFNVDANEKAIAIIKNYPGKWNGSADKIPQKANVTIKFK